MCFSEAASFTGAGVIAAVALFGYFLNYKSLAVRVMMVNKSKACVLTPEQVQTMLIDRHYWWPFLSTPLLFAIQQAWEGVVWVQLNSGNDSSPPGIAFSFFAYAFWPLWVPIICLMLEVRPLNRVATPSRQRTYWLTRCALLLCLVLCGLVLFIYSFGSIISSGLRVTESNDHLVYHFSMFNDPNNFALTIPYLACTVLAFLLATSIVAHWALSLAIGGSAIIAYLLYTAETFPSVWCFFAAWISVCMIIVRVVAILRWNWPAPPASSSADPLASTMV